MKRRMLFVLVMAVSLAVMSPIFSFAQGQEVEPERQWIWGEVIFVDNQKNELLVQYLDYDTEQERELNISVNEKTAYENVGVLIDIKPSDVVSVDFLVLPDARLLAEKISVEKPETALPPSVSQQEDK